MPDTAQQDVDESTAAPPLPYRVQCACGRTHVGTRGEEAIVVVCPKCAAKTLIFPGSPLAKLRGPLPGLPVETRPNRLMRWRRPLVAGGIALIVVVASLVMLLNSQWFRSSDTSEAAREEQRRQHTTAGNRALADADFPKAAAEFHLARQALSPETMSSEARWLRQIEAETAVMADLSTETLEDVLLLAKGLSDRAWRDLFQSRYRNKAFIFDAEVQSAGAGVFRLDYIGLVAGQPMRIEIHDSRTLRTLPVEWPARLILGLRLAETKRDARGRWLVLADPEAVVLFTNSDCFRTSSIAIDSEFEDVLRWQARLLDISPP